MLPIDRNHQRNHRDDSYRDYTEQKARGLVRDKLGRIVPIDKPHNNFTPLQRDQLYQAYCEMMNDTSPKSSAFTKSWLRESVKTIRGASGRTMSVGRARDIINEGNGEWPGANMQWWRGVSLP